MFEWLVSRLRSFSRPYNILHDIFLGPHGYISARLVSLCRRGTTRHPDRLTGSQAVEAMQSFFSMLPLELVAIRQVGWRVFRDR
jgi:hypothetical protein